MAVKDYFVEATKQLNASQSGLEADLDEIHNYKFLCSFYRNGDLITRCKIWRGSPFSEECIAYSDGRQLDINSDSSMSEWMTVVQVEDLLLLEASGGSFFGRQANDKRQMSAEEAAEHLWETAIEVFNRG
jgi:hypothetical protein